MATKTKKQLEAELAEVEAQKKGAKGSQIGKLHIKSLRLKKKLKEFKMVVTTPYGSNDPQEKRRIGGNPGGSGGRGSGRANKSPGSSKPRPKDNSGTKTPKETLNKKPTEAEEKRPRDLDIKTPKKDSTTDDNSGTLVTPNSKPDTVDTGGGVTTTGNTRGPGKKFTNESQFPDIQMRVQGQGGQEDDRAIWEKFDLTEEQWDELSVDDQEAYADKDEKGDYTPLKGEEVVETTEDAPEIVEDPYAVNETGTDAGGLGSSHPDEVGQNNIKSLQEQYEAARLEVEEYQKQPKAARNSFTEKEMIKKRQKLFSDWKSAEGSRELDYEIAEKESDIDDLIENGASTHAIDTFKSQLQDLKNKKTKLTGGPLEEDGEGKEDDDTKDGESNEDKSIIETSNEIDEVEKKDASTPNASENVAGEIATDRNGRQLENGTLSKDGLSIVLDGTWQPINKAEKWTDGRVIVSKDELGLPTELLNEDGSFESVIYEGKPPKDKNGNILVPQEGDYEIVQIIDKETGKRVSKIVFKDTRTQEEIAQDKLDEAQRKLADDQAEANEVLAAIRDDQGEETAKAYESFKKQQAEEKANIKKEQEDLESVIDVLTTSKIDTNRYWNNKTSGQKEASLMAILLGSLSTSENHTNVVLDMIDDNIKRDIDAQKLDLLNIRKAGDLQNSLVGRLYQSLNNLPVASQTAQLLLTQSFVSKLEAMKLKTNNPILKSKMEVEIQKQHKLLAAKRDILVRLQKKQQNASIAAQNKKNTLQTNVLRKSYDERFAKVKLEDTKYAFDSIVNGYLQNDPAGDRAMIQGVARLHDPGSTVKHDEVAYWGNQYGVATGTIWSLWQELKALTPGSSLKRKLGPDERQALFAISKGLMRNKLGSVRNINSEFSRLVYNQNKTQGYSMDPLNVTYRSGQVKDYLPQKVNLINRFKKDPQYAETAKGMNDDQLWNFIIQKYPGLGNYGSIN